MLNKPSIIAMHPNGNANVRAAMNGFANAGLLKEFHTAIACFEDSFLHSISIGPLSEFKRRKFDNAIRQFTYTHGFMELMRLLSMKAGWKSLYRHEHGRYSVDAVYRDMDRMLSRRIQNGHTADVIYAYEDGAQFSFEAAKKLGIKSYYDLPIGYWRMARTLLKEEQEKRPDWGMTITGFNDSNSKLERKDMELELSDAVFVASSFTASTLDLYPGKLKKIRVVPYGFPLPVQKEEYQTSRDNPLKVLYVGGLSQRKGIANLFEAVKAIGKSIELTVVGGKGNVECKALDEALSTCKWIPSLPHNQILELMRQNDVLAFPSLFEGFGLVITEAMSQGTPVITTDRTAGPDIISNGQDGWIIEAGSTHALIEILTKLEEDRNLVAEAGLNACRKASKRTWEAYGLDLSQNVIQEYETSAQLII